ncbi:hypothetical protein MFUM_390004 [Methylacidiphilum fumariolicum SolV]|uniref:Uncharacterized protein n=2 Tax=Candidatus Methylacidiphilum fumarolicum TaxID=591154 RepID=I0JY34_METFB|nr:conserved protein of unknown function [Candidatus Methylacidiphilum fumarolicum]CCG92153.1 hypothetical protein MFUM_390004 [Methylacidiphilum fumariolicum SolV]
MFLIASKPMRPFPYKKAKILSVLLYCVKITTFVNTELVFFLAAKKTMS